VSLQQIQELIHRVEEALGLLKVLVDHQFHTMAATLSKVTYAFSNSIFQLNNPHITETPLRSKSLKNIKFEIDLINQQGY
jgi:ABC-type transporter Mla maintaining outer membrane lipid asymmetry ATPase subunit MlaF